MSVEEPAPISITLSPAQVDQVLRAASRSRAPNLSVLLGDSLGVALRPPAASERRGEAPASGGVAAHQARAQVGFMPSHTDDPRLSRSLLRGLSILTCFDADGRERGIVELAADLRMSPSTAHRYAMTLVELGLLERCPRTRKYRLPGRAMLDPG